MFLCINLACARVLVRRRAHKHIWFCSTIENYYKMHAIVSMAHSAVFFRFLSPFPVKLYPGNCLNLLSYMKTKLSRPVNFKRHIYTRYAGHSMVSGYWYTQVWRTICVPFARLAASGIASGYLYFRLDNQVRLRLKNAARFSIDIRLYGAFLNFCRASSG